jgi:cytosine deaminase
LSTSNAAGCRNITGDKLEVGGNADLVILNAPSVWEAIRNHEAPLYVIKDGKDVTSR